VSRTPAITVQGVSKRYRLYQERNQSLKATLMRRRRARYEEFWALRHVSFEVAEGATFGLIGENGSGKSTMLKCMAKILRPDHGSIATRGKISALLELGAGFHQELSGRENVYLNGAILGLSKRQIDERFDKIVDFAGLEHFIDTPVKSYSSGMYVRLGFSVAINVEPDILLIDEILAVGDEDFQRKCGEKFEELRSRGKTIVIVSHALPNVRNLCDEVALLEHGDLRRVGPAGDVIDEYIGDVMSKRMNAGERGGRWGSGEAVIEDIEMLDTSGEPAKRVRTGDTVVFRLHYSTTQPVERPVFTLGVHALSGIFVGGASTRDENKVPDTVDGTGFLDFRIDRLMLVPGTYDLTASVLNYSLTHMFDYRHRSFRFDVEAGVPRADEEGLVALGGTWEGPSVDDGP
jgi:ABC-type polysaccharide/polyol phosphate transport system ATPase subunit